jgi:hypothetical protein
MSRLLGLLLFIAACDGDLTVPVVKPSSPPQSVSIQLAVDPEVLGNAVVAVGDSMMTADAGERTRCIRWDGLQGPATVRTWVNASYAAGYLEYQWAVKPPQLNLWVSVQQLPDSSLWVVWTWVNRTCGDTTLSMPASERARIISAQR